MPDARREVSMLSKGEAAALLSLINAHHRATRSGMMFS